MRTRQFIYLDKGALGFFLANLPRGGGFDDAQERRDDLWRCFKKMTFGSSALVHLGYSKQEFFKEVQSSEYLQILWQHTHTAGNQVEFYFDGESFPNKGEKIKETDVVALSSLFFISNTEAVESFHNKGINIITPETFYKQSIERYGCDSRVPSFRKGEKASWNFLKKVRSFFNSMIIADLYIHDSMDTNLLRILDCLLPKSLDNIDFHLTVFTHEADRSITEVFQKINTFLREKRPNLSCKLSVFRAGKNDFHSRSIITNQIWMDNNGGFDLIDKEGIAKKTASISLWHPFASNKKVAEYNDSIDDVKKLFEKAIHCGEPVNRLFDLQSQE